MFNKCVFSKEKDLVFRVAASKNDIKKLIVLKNDVNINSAGTESQQTAAHRAAAGGHIEALQLLFNLGADFSLPDKEGKTPRDYAKTEEAKKLFLLIEEGYTALKARKSIFSQTDSECSNDERILHGTHWAVINEKIHHKSQYELAIQKTYKEEAGKKNLTVEEKAQFSLFQQKFSSSMALLHHLVTKKIIFDVTTETGQTICSCGEAAASSFVWLAYFKKVDFPVEELNVTCKHDVRIAHAVLILNRDQNTLITDFNGWKESLIIDPYFNRIFFFNFVSQYSQDTCIKIVDKFNLIAGSTNIHPPFPTEVSLPATMSLYNKCVTELRENIGAKMVGKFSSLIEDSEPTSKAGICSNNSF